MLTEMICAGFGGQGVLTTGSLIAYCAFDSGKIFTWYPSYGSEMRGGTANCSVCISDEPIGSPLVVNPDILVAMNLPSLDKFVNDVVPGGTIIIDSSLIDKKVERKDVNVIYLPASKLAEDAGVKGAANMIIVGRLFKELNFCSKENLDKGLQKSIPPKKIDLLDKNRKMIQIGIDS